MPTREQVYEVLKKCYDPEIPVNIVDLGLIYEVSVGDDSVSVNLTLTSSHCPAAQAIPENVKSKLLKLEGVKSADVRVVLDPPWSPDRISPEGKRILGI